MTASATAMINQGAATAASNRRIMVIASVSSISRLLFGFDTGIIAGAIVLLKKAWPLNPLTEGLIVSSVLCGGLIGAAISGKAADAFRRGATMSATTGSLSWLILDRAGADTRFAHRRPGGSRPCGRRRFGRRAALLVGNRSGEDSGRGGHSQSARDHARHPLLVVVSALFSRRPGGMALHADGRRRPGGGLGYAMLSASVAALVDRQPGRGQSATHVRRLDIPARIRRFL